MTDQLVPVRLFDLGYGPLVSVIPPNGPLSPHSRIQPSQRGKTPGRKNANETWGGYDWLKHVPTRIEVQQWAQDGANIGILAAGFPGVDIDSLDESLAVGIEKLTIKMLGNAPTRIGKPPKRLLMYRTKEPFARMAVIIKTPDGVSHLVEVLGQGRQYLIAGIHPSGNAYKWNFDPVGIKPDSLTWITREKVDGFLNALVDYIPTLCPGATVDRVGDGTIRDRETVAASDLHAPSIDALREAVQVIPNSDDLFPGREDYIKFGYAVKASMPEADEEDAFEVFASWAARHVTDGRVAGNPDTWRSDWRKMDPPYAIGWPWIAEQAARFGFNAAAHEFTAMPVEAAKAAIAQDESGPPAYSDPWLAERVIAESGHQMRFCAGENRWYVWDDTRWKPDGVLLADNKVQSVLTKVGIALAKQGMSDKERKENALKSIAICSAHRVREVRATLKADPRVAIPAEAFDRDPWLLNTPAGTFDLRTGERKQNAPEDLCAKRTLVAPDPDMPTPVWTNFLREVTLGDVELQKYLQRLAGYALTGRIDEQVLAFIWGTGQNGKGKFLNALTQMMGDYGYTADMAMFTASLGERHPADIAKLVGKRLVGASESDSGRRWDEQRIKNMTGGDPLTARLMRQDFFTFMPQFKLIFIGNYRPEIRNLDDAMKRRIHMVPFRHVVTEAKKDDKLGDKIHVELPGVLSWALTGARDWAADGLRPPQSVLDTTAEYFAEEDPVGRWIEDRCDRDVNASATTTELFHSFEEWATARNEFVGSIKRFAQMLTAKHFPRWQDPATRRAGYRGLIVRKLEALDAL